METYPRNEKENNIQEILKLKNTILINWFRNNQFFYFYRWSTHYEWNLWNPKMESQKKLKTTQKDIKTF